MRLTTALIIAAATAAVIGSSAPALYEPEAPGEALRQAAPVISDGRSAFDNLSLGAPSTEGHSVNVSVAGQIPRPPAIGATLGAPGPGPVQLALVNAYLGAVRGAPPACRLRAEVLAAIAQVESGSAGGQSLSGNRVVPGVYGPLLSGGEVAAVADTDGGRLDGDAQWDRALGPMQFIPSAWTAFGTDGDGDGTADPQNVYDAAVSAALYLCAGGRDLSQPTELAAAILSYNHSGPYLLAVLEWIEYFGSHGLVAIGPVSVPLPTQGPTAPKKTEPKTVTEEVIRQAVKKAAELPVAPPPPQPGIPARQSPSPTSNNAWPSTSSTEPWTTTTTTTPPATTTTTPDPTTTTPPTTTTTLPTSTTTLPTSTTTTDPEPTTTTPPTSTSTTDSEPPRSSTTTSEPPPPPPISTSTTTPDPPPPPPIIITSTTTSSSTTQPEPTTTSSTSSEPPPPTTTSTPTSTTSTTTLPISVTITVDLRGLLR